jgi:hypothetical protein
MERVAITLSGYNHKCPFEFIPLFLIAQYNTKLLMEIIIAAKITSFVASPMITLYSQLLFKKSRKGLAPRINAITKNQTQLMLSTQWANAGQTETTNRVKNSTDHFVSPISQNPKCLSFIFHPLSTQQHALRYT